jgi:hypothetical protein
MQAAARSRPALTAPAAPHAAPPPTRSIKRNFVCPPNVERCVVIHSGREGPLFKRTRRRLRAAPGGGGSSGGSGGGGRGGLGAAGRRGRALLSGGCNITAPAPLVHWTNKQFKQVQIFPGQYAAVNMM